MGVLECDRKGCKRIMSEYYSHKHGYLCSECYEEGIKQSFPPETFVRLPKMTSKIVNYSFLEEYKKVDEE